MRELAQEVLAGQAAWVVGGAVRDELLGREVIDLLHGLHAAGATIAVITHDPQVAASMPRCVALRDGRLESDTAVAA